MAGRNPHGLAELAARGLEDVLAQEYERRDRLIGHGAFEFEFLAGKMFAEDLFRGGWTGIFDFIAHGLILPLSFSRAGFSRERFQNHSCTIGLTCRFPKAHSDRRSFCSDRTRACSCGPSGGSRSCAASAPAPGSIPTPRAAGCGS